MGVEVWVGVGVIVGVGVGFDGKSCDAGTISLYWVGDDQYSLIEAEPVFSINFTVMEYLTPAVSAIVPQCSAPLESVLLTNCVPLTHSCPVSLCHRQKV